MIAAVLVRIAYLAVSHAFAALWLLRMSAREKDVEIGGEGVARSLACALGARDVASAPAVGQPGYRAEVR
ncbi:hypothetical protein [Lentzea aerocolonigenes]|uniref:hypothetical protein n=1 Tax=Lentzea aerocolonigenes TaxID=68170 RepID=UPI000A7BE4BE|nr:hypothetical protein [Lentzea aerocolonigenes]